MTRRWAGDRGDAAIELALGVALLLLPVLALVGTLPRWVDHREGAAAAAAEAARVAASEFPEQDLERARAAARDVLVAHGVSLAEAAIDIEAAVDRGDVVRASVRVRVPALRLPLIGEAGAWSVTVTASRRIEDHRSR